MTKVFVSYRREDTRDVTGRICDRLSSRFGRASVLRDVDTMPLGVDFREHLGTWIADCDVALVVIGERWLGAGSGEGGGRRIDDAADYVRVEVEAALGRGIPVVPVLVGAARMPAADDLPAGIRDLAFRHAAEVRPDPDFHAHVDRLLRGLEPLLGERGDDVKENPTPTPSLTPIGTSIANALDQGHPRDARVEAAPDVKTLAEMLRRGLPLPEPMVVRLAGALLDALRDAGAAPLGIDPACIALGALSADPIPVIATVDRKRPRSVAYAAPEELRAPSVVASHVYTVAQIAWEFVMGRPAFTGDDASVRLAKLRQSWGLRIRQPPLCVSPALERWILGCTNPDVAARTDPTRARADLGTLATSADELAGPTNLDFTGPLVGGEPYGWSDSLGWVDGVSLDYAFAVEESDDHAGRCLHLWRYDGPPREFGSVMQRIPAAWLADRTVRLAATVKADVRDWAGLWLRGDGRRQPHPRQDRLRWAPPQLFFDNMHDRPIKGSTGWVRHGIEARCPPEIEWLCYGALLCGGGDMWIRDAEISVRAPDGRWIQIGWTALRREREP